jgi:tRNA nucleotidyltransferase (CCA-adding enzyme)
MVISIPDFIREIMDRIESAGYEAFVVGGSLRDILLGKEPHDWDVTTSALPETVASLFPDKHVIPTGIKHGTVTVVSEGEPVEITTYRVDGEYTDSRRPDRVEFTRNIEDDLSRRDFTVNALAYNEKRGLIDLFGGKSDLENKIIRAVGDPEKRFTEDALRIMRAFRFSAQLGFDIEERTLLAARRLSPRLKNIARERIGSEFIRLLASPEPERSLTLMDHVIYEILPVENIDKNSYVLCDAIGPDAFSRLALILYGKSNEELTGVAHALRLSNEQKKRMILLATPAEEKFECTALSARRFLHHYGDVWRGAARILTLLGSVSPDFEDAANAEAEKKPCLTIGGLDIDGSEIISLGLASGREVGALLSYLLDEVIRDPSLNERERLAEKAKSHLNIK